MIVIGTAIDVPVDGTAIVSCWAPERPAGIAKVTDARPTSSVVSTIVGSMAEDPTTVPPIESSTVDAAGSPALNASDERSAVTDSPTAYAAPLAGAVSFTPTARWARSGDDGRVGGHVVDHRLEVDLAGVAPSAFPAARVKKLSPPEARNELTTTRMLSSAATGSPFSSTLVMCDPTAAVGSSV